MTSFPVKMPHQGGYCATSGCACAHSTQGISLRGHVTFGHFRYLQYLYYRTTFCSTIVRKKRGENDVTSCAEHTSGHVTDVTFGHVISDDVTSGQDRFRQLPPSLLPKYGFRTTSILLTLLQTPDIFILKSLSFRTC